MTQTTPPDGNTPETATGPDIPLHPSDILMTLIVALLAPMFLGASGGDIGFARMAAIETVSAYRIRNQADLLAVAQIVAFGLAALGSLSLSMADDLSLSMTLRLRGNANALNRSAEQNRRVLLQTGVNPPLPDAVPMVEQHPESEEDEQAQAKRLLDLAAAQELAAQAGVRLRNASQPPAPAPEQTAVADTVSTRRTRCRRTRRLQ